MGFALMVACLVLWCSAGTDGAAVMSVDFGSEWMKVGVVSPGVPMEIALNKESKRKTPAVLSIRDGLRFFGEDAQTVGVRFPSSAYSYLLDLLGKTYDNPLVESYQKRFPYYEMEADPERNTVLFKNGDILYSVEELVAQLLNKAREFAEDSTGQPITECVIVVPGFFNQAERTAMLSAAQLANLKVLQLINDYTAVALNYGIFRRGEMNETAQYFVFYDMGAQKTTATVVSYQLVKDKATRETNPVVQILGVGYDRTLGGLEMQIRLRDHLAKEFNNMKKTKTDVFTNGRALAKLFKESGRVKNVLSANTDHFAQVESLLDDVDFRVQVTREQFEELNADLFDRVAAPLERALSASGLTMDVITQVILFGGGTRVPKVQERLKNFIQQELGKNLNADEAAVMGAVYKAADLATGFKVKKFAIKDAVLFPIQVVFEREGESGNKKQVKRNLFAAMNPYPQKKVITFNKNMDDFSFEVNYAELEHLPSNEVPLIGTLNISSISLTNVAKIMENNLGEGVESKGIKAHFVLDDSGIFSLSGVELVMEKQAVDSDDESPLSKLSNTISNLFSSGKKEGDAPEGDPKEGEQPEEAAEEKPAVNETATNATKLEEEIAAAVKNATEKPKVVTVKEPIPNEVKILYTVPLDGVKYAESKSRIDELNKIDQIRHHRETALNDLESFVIEAQVRLDQKEYASCASDEEAEALRKACSEVSEWLYEEGENAETETYEAKLKELQELANEIYARHWEHSERPEALKALAKLLDGANGFLKSAKNLTKEANPVKDVFTNVEIETLERVITETKDWSEKEAAAQKKLKRKEPVKMTVKMITDKMALLDREVKYLVNKIKIWKPKAKEPKADDGKKIEEGEEKKTEETESDEVPKEEDVAAGAEDAEQMEVPPIEETVTPTETTQEESTPRSDL